MKEPIYKIKDIKLDELDREWPLQIWFYNMVQKRIKELTLDDIGRMLRQDVFVDIAIPLAQKSMLSEPFEGEMYEGELLVAMTGILKKYPDMKDYNFYELFVKKVHEQIDDYDRGCEENKEAYKKEFDAFCEVFEASVLQENGVMRINWIEVIKNKTVPEVEELIKQELERNPEDVQLWLKLCLTELRFPFEDYVSALECIKKVYELSENHIDALILEAGITWHVKRIIDEELFERLKNVKCDDARKKAILTYLQALYYQGKNNSENQRKYLEESITLWNEFVYPYSDLGLLLHYEGKDEAARGLFKWALSNVRSVWNDNDFHDYTDIEAYIAEFITGTAISYVNYEYLEEQVQK